MHLEEQRGKGLEWDKQLVDAHRHGHLVALHHPPISRYSSQIFQPGTALLYYTTRVWMHGTHKSNSSVDTFLWLCPQLQHHNRHVTSQPYAVYQELWKTGYKASEKEKNLPDDGVHPQQGDLSTAFTLELNPHIF